MTANDTWDVRRLSIAIIRQAVVDYVRARNYISTYSGDDQRVQQVSHSKRTIDECERFFRSRYFELLNPYPLLTGEDIITKLQDDSIGGIA